MISLSVDLKEFLSSINKAIAIASTLNRFEVFNALLELDTTKEQLRVNYTDDRKRFTLITKAHFNSFDSEEDTKTIMVNLKLLSDTLSICSGTSHIKTSELEINVNTDTSLLEFSIQHFITLEETEDDKTKIITESVGKVNQSLKFYDNSVLEDETSRVSHMFKRLVDVDYNNLCCGEVSSFPIKTLKELGSKKGSNVRNFYFSNLQKSAFTATISSLSVIPYENNTDIFFILNSCLASTLLDIIGEDEVEVYTDVQDKETIITFKTNSVVLQSTMDKATQVDIATYNNYTQTDYTDGLVVYKEVVLNLLNNINRFNDSSTTVKLETSTIGDTTYLIITSKSAVDTKTFRVKVLNKVTNGWNFPIEVNTQLLLILVGSCSNSDKITLLQAVSTDNSISFAVYDSGEELSLEELNTIGRYYTKVSKGGK